MEENHYRQVLDLAAAIQQIPAPTFHEQARAQFVCSRFQAEGLQDVAIDETGNVLGRLPGAGTGRPVLVSAHLDTVFPQDTPLTLTQHSDRMAGPGIGDNSLGLAGLFSLIWTLGRYENGKRVSALPGDLWLAANVGEEGLGDLNGMRAVVDRFGNLPAAYIILEGMALGQIYHRGLGVRRYRITVETVGGHSWVDYGQPSAIHEMARVIAELTRLDLPEKPRTTLNVGQINGGTSVNTIAALAQIELDLRSEGLHALSEVTNQVTELVARANRPGVKVTAQETSVRPFGEISSNHPLVKLAVKAYRNSGSEICLSTGSTDANAPLSRGLPAVCVGLTHGAGAHTRNEFIYTRPLMAGLSSLAALIRSIDGQGFA